MYLNKDFGSPKYWDALIQALQASESSYGLALAALKQRGGIMLEAHFPIACGSPVRQIKKLSPETVYQRLEQAGLLDRHEIPGVGNCIALVQGPNRYDGAAAKLQARLVTERLLLGAVREWVRNLGLGSYGRVETREGANLPRVGTFAWDLSAPSYLAPMVQWGDDGSQKQGFIACDVLLGVEVDELGISPFINKCKTLRSFKNVGRTLQIFVAERYTKPAFDMLKSEGVIPATTASLFGRDAAEGLAQLSTVLQDAARLVAEPEMINEIFQRLGKVEGVAANLRGALFEYLSAELARATMAPAIKMNMIIQGEDGRKAEVDVIAEVAYRSVCFIECKGYKPFGAISEGIVNKWLTDRVPLIYAAARKHSVWKDLEIRFEFWTTGQLSPKGVAMINQAATTIRPTKYTVGYRDADSLHALAKGTNNTGLVRTLEQNFLKHPMADIEPSYLKGSAKPATTFACKNAPGTTPEHEIPASE